MGVMTDRAGFCLYRIITMSFFKTLLSFVMTGKTKGDRFLFQKSLVVRTVGKMTGLATAILKDFVYHLLLIVFFFVAIIADIVALGLEKMAGLRGMRVMAEGTLTHSHC